MRGDRRTVLLLLCALVPIALAGSAVAFARSGSPSHPKPAHRRLPAITGAAQVGRVLHASKGRWTEASRFTYSWELCNAHGARCKPIAKAAKRPKHKASAYLIPAKDLGHRIRVVVVASNKSGKTSATSRATAVVSEFRATGQNPVPGPGSGTKPPAGLPGDLGNHQMFANYLAWANDLGSNLPWNDMTQVVMFALKTTNGTALDASTNEVSHYNLPNWTAMIHSHGEDAFIAIGGSNDGDWQDACNSSNQAGFVTNLVNYIVSNGFDGVDLDIENSGSLSASQLEGCVQAIATAAHAATTKQGKTPVVAEEMDESLYNSMPYSTIQSDIADLDQVQLEYFGFNPYSDWNCSTGTPANTCAYVTQMVAHALNQGIPANKLLLGMAVSGSYAQGTYSTLAPTISAVNTTTGMPASIPVASISSTISAGDVVLATTENPPAHYQVFTTSGTGVCTSNCSIPITGEVYGNGAYSFPSGSVVQSAYAGPWDCYNMGHYAATHGLKGGMIFELQSDAGNHNGSFSCSDQIALGLGS